VAQCAGPAPSWLRTLAAIAGSACCVLVRRDSRRVGSKSIALPDRRPSATHAALRAISDPIRYDAAGRHDGSGQESAGAGSTVNG